MLYLVKTAQRGTEDLRTPLNVMPTPNAKMVKQPPSFVQTDCFLTRTPDSSLTRASTPQMSNVEAGQVSVSFRRSVIRVVTVAGKQYIQYS